MDELPPFDVDVAAMEPSDFVRILVSRALTGDSLAWAEIGWDVMRYGRHDDVAAVMLGMIEQLLGVIARESGMTSVALWRSLMLSEQDPA